MARSSGQGVGDGFRLRRLMDLRCAMAPEPMAAESTAPTVMACITAPTAMDDLIKLVQKLNQAMNAADRIGLIVKPDISTATSQFGGTGSAGHMASIKVSRKLC